MARFLKFVEFRSKAIFALLILTMIFVHNNFDFKKITIKGKNKLFFTFLRPLKMPMYMVKLQTVNG